MKKKDFLFSFLFSVFLVFIIYPATTNAQEKNVPVYYSASINSSENLAYPDRYEKLPSLVVTEESSEKMLPQTGEKEALFLEIEGCLLVGFTILVRSWYKKESEPDEQS